MLGLQPHDDLVCQTLGDHRLSRWLGMLPSEAPWPGTVTPFPRASVELLADGSLAGPDRSRDLGLRLTVFHHPGDDLTVLRAEVFMHC